MKAVVSQARWSDGYQNFRRLVRPDFIAGFQEQFDADRLARYHGQAPAMVPVVAEDPLGTVGVADTGLLPVVHREPQENGAVVA